MMTSKLADESAIALKPKRHGGPPCADSEGLGEPLAGDAEAGGSAYTFVSSETACGSIDVSVIVPVHDRTDHLRQLLMALAEQDYGVGDFEVLVCDDGSREDVKAIVEEFSGVEGPAVLYLRQSHQGAGAARNLGVAHARGRILAFTDSDCEPAKNWLSELTGPFRDASVGIVGGAVAYRSAKYLSGRCVNYVMSTGLGAGGARDPRAAVRMTYRPRTYNCAVRSDLARRVGGFPSGTYGEDTEFSHKIAELGTEVQFVPTAEVVHNEKRTLWQAGSVAFRKGAARVRITLRCGGHEIIHALPASLCLYLGCLLLTLVWTGCVPLWSLVPAILYGTVLAGLALDGAVRLASPVAGVLVPFCAVAMHLGYGLGYLYGWCSAVTKRKELPPISGDRRT